MPSFRPPLHPRSTLPPPRRVGLRCPTPVGHGRGLASRTGCAVPGEGVASPWLRPASPTPGERGRRRRAPAASPAASRCSPSLATLSVCLRYCLAESGGASADQHFCHVHRRQPAQLASRRITPLFLSSPVTARGAATTPERRDRSLLGCATPQQVSANTLAHPTIDVELNR